MTAVRSPILRRGSDFSVLSKLVQAERLLDRRPLEYTVRITLTLAFYVAVWTTLVLVGDSWWQLGVAVLLGIALTQVAFLGHDGGHQQIFRSRRANDLFGRLIGNVLLGLSFGWWVAKHNRHHANPNKQDEDPDIGDGVLAYTTEQAAAHRGWIGTFVTTHQAWLFFPLLAFEGISLHVSSIRALLPGAQRSPRGGSRLAEATLLSMHAVAYVGAIFLLMPAPQALAVVAVSQAVWGFYMGCSFAPNHKGMAIIDRDQQLDFLRRQVLTSRNVRGGPLTDLALGGLNYQIEHHLFPNMPRSSLRRARPIVRQFCEQHAVPYCETSVFGSYRAALSYLHALGSAQRARV